VGQYQHNTPIGDSLNGLFVIRHAFESQSLNLG
jgi:hypothetical protein